MYMYIICTKTTHLSLQVSQQATNTFCLSRSERTGDDDDFATLLELGLLVEIIVLDNVGVIRMR